MNLNPKQEKRLDKIMKELEVMFGKGRNRHKYKIKEDNRHWTLACEGCRMDIYQVVAMSYRYGYFDAVTNISKRGKNVKERN